MRKHQIRPEPDWHRWLACQLWTFSTIRILINLRPHANPPADSAPPELPVNNFRTTGGDLLAPTLVRRFRLACSILAKSAEPRAPRKCFQLDCPTTRRFHHRRSRNNDQNFALLRDYPARASTRQPQEHVRPYRVAACSSIRVFPPRPTSEPGILTNTRTSRQIRRLSAAHNRPPGSTDWGGRLP